MIKYYKNLTSEEKLEKIRAVIAHYETFPSKKKPLDLLDIIVRILEMYDYDKNRISVTKCPFCGQSLRINTDRLDARKVGLLYAMYRFAGTKPKKINSKIEYGTQRSCFSKLQHWNFVEQCPDHTGVVRKSIWRVTERGEDFLLGKISVKRNAEVFDTRVLSYEGDLVDINTNLPKNIDRWEDYVNNSFFDMNHIFNPDIRLITQGEENVDAATKS